MAKGNYLEKRLQFLPVGAIKVQDKLSSAVAYIYTDKRDRLCLRAFYGRRFKPSLSYYYTTPQAREKRVEEFFRSIRAHEERQKKTNGYHSLEIGNILYSSWGYDQTNVDFYEVVGFKGKTLVLLREVEQIKDQSGDMSGTTKPVPGKYKSGQFQRRCTANHIISITKSQSAYLWDGKPKSYTSYG